MHDDHDDVDAEPGPGHNQPRAAVAQWQTPHLPEGAKVDVTDRPEADFDLVEASFVEGFSVASDPTSFLRLAGVPFAGRDAEGRRFSLLRVALESVTDIGSLTPHLGGATFRYDPLPAKLVSKRRKLCFIYPDGSTLRSLSLGEARALRPAMETEAPTAMASGEGAARSG
jgi:hypothetical protein